MQDLGINIVNSCYGRSIFEKNLKNISQGNDFIFNNLRKIKRLLKKNENPEIISKTQIELQQKKFKNYDELPVPFIKGLINDDYYIQKKTISEDEKYEYDKWLRSHGGNWNTHYDNGSQINKDNIEGLKLLWKYSSIDKNKIERYWKQNIEVNPVFINGKLIFITADWKIVAIEIETGKKIWEINTIAPSRRGLLVEVDKITKTENLYVPILNKIFKFNAKSGKIIKNFGNSGSINIFSLTSPAIYGDFLISVNSSVSIISKNSGEIISSISLHPTKKNFKGGIAWTGFALDKKKGIIYAGTGNPRPATVGISREGNNENSSSLVAVDLNQKKILWNFQAVSHDIWDYDVVGPPIIHNLKLENKIFEIVILLSKTGNPILLERNTGKPIFDINYSRAPKSNVPGEITAPFQIDLIKPEKYSKIEYSKNEINLLSKNKQKEILNNLDNSIYGWFEPPSFNKDLIIFGLHGGASWMGAGLDPLNQHLYIPVNHMPWKIRPYFASTEISPNIPKELKSEYNFYIQNCSSCHGKKRNGKIIKNGEKLISKIPSLVGLNFQSNKYLNKKLTNFNSYHQLNNLDKQNILNLEKLFNYWDKKIKDENEIRIVSDSSTWSYFLTNDGLPASNPPWGYLAKINLSNGKLMYKKPLGYLEVDGKEKLVGTPNYGGLALNEGGIIFFNGTNDNKAYAIDSVSGDILWTYQMDAAGSAPPIIFKHKNKQYVSFVSTGGQYAFFNKKSSTIYTFGIE
tara:strand:- start:6235 stop:8466 length:2232 start_codon:yes stop_codon:yes gene_type:complete